MRILIRKGVKLKYFIIFFVLIVFCGCKDDNKTNMLMGKWTSLSVNSVDFSLKFGDKNIYITEIKSRDLHFIAKGKYTIKGDTLFLKDYYNSPVILCDYSETGIYIFKRNNDTIRFNPIKDNCERRKLTLEIGLVKSK